MFYSNIDESTMADIIKPTVPGKSIINLNSLDKYTLLVDQYYNKAEDRRNYLIHTKIYSENGNMFTEIIKKAASPFAAEIWECIANNQITLQETAKKDIAIVSNTARLITIKRED